MTNEQRWDWYIAGEEINTTGHGEVEHSVIIKCKRHPEIRIIIPELNHDPTWQVAVAKLVHSALKITDYLDVLEVKKQ